MKEADHPGKINKVTGEVIQPIHGQRIPDRVTEKVEEIREPNVEMMKAFHQERLRKPTVDQIEVIQPVVQERISDCVVEQIVDVLVPEIRDHIVEVMKSQTLQAVGGRQADWRRHRGAGRWSMVHWEV